VVTAALIEYFVSMSGKGGNTEKRADVPVIFFDKCIDLAVQMEVSYYRLLIGHLICLALATIELLSSGIYLTGIQLM
jgi:hypothetical protein